MPSSAISFIDCASFALWIRFLTTDGSWPGMDRVLLLARLRDYLHLAPNSAGLPTSIVPHQLRHTYGTEMLRAGVGFAAVTKLLGHTDPGMTMRYVDVTLTDLQREFELARSKPRHRLPSPKPHPRLCAQVTTG